MSGEQPSPHMSLSPSVSVSLSLRAASDTFDHPFLMLIFTLSL